MNKNVNVAVVGLGTVGGGLCHLLINKGNEAYKNINLYAICDLNEKRCQEIKDSTKEKILIYHDYIDVLKDKNIDIIVELMGGDRIAFDLISRALKNNISVVSANKQVIANHYDEFMELLKTSNAHFMFEASVGGVIPIINNMVNYSKVNDIKEIKGIINGSTNYVLTLMQKDGIGYQEAMQKATELGFLEADPSADIDGLDILRKITILSNIAYRTYINVNDVYVYSLKNVNDNFIKKANELGFTLKYMAQSNLTKNGVGIRVEPTLIKDDSLYSMINYERNHVSYFSQSTGLIDMSGFGAGRYPTASAVMSDIIQLANNQHYYGLDINSKLNVFGNKNYEDIYLIELKENEKLPKEMIDVDLGNFVLTKKIKGYQLNDVLEKIKFYGRVIEHD